MSLPADWTGLGTVAPAKINATLIVGPIRPEDGRHELVSVMQSLALADEVTLRLRAATPDGGLIAGDGTVAGEVPEAGDATAAASERPNDGSTAAGDVVDCPGVTGDNLALRALTAFREATGWDVPPLRIEIVKRIPVAAGMAGGSADAGAVLRLAAHASGQHDPALLQRLAAGLGADVPHQLQPGLAVAAGAGEQLVRSTGVLPGALVVLRADVGLSTPAVFRRADELRPPREQATLSAWHERLTQAIIGPAGPALPESLRINDLQPAAVDLAPVVDTHLQQLAAVGATGPMVCGSGPTTIGWFADVHAAATAAAQLRREGYDALMSAPASGAPVVPA